MRTTIQRAVTVPPILDRLLDDKPRDAAEYPHAMLFHVRAYKVTLARVLEALLNTRHVIYGFLLSLVMTQAGCSFLPVTNYLPEPQAKVDIKIFRGYAKVQNQPWQVTLTYEPQVLLDGESAEIREVQKGNRIFHWTSNELLSSPVHIVIPDSAVVKTGEQTFSFAIPRETLNDRPGNYVLHEMEISKGEAKIVRAKVILPERATMKKAQDPTPTCVYDTRLSPPHPASPILRARYHGGMLQFESNDPPSYTSVSKDCETLTVNPLLEYLPWNKGHGLWSAREIDHILAHRRAPPTDPYYAGVEAYAVPADRVQVSSVWKEIVQAYPYFSAWYWKQNGQLIKASYCAEKHSYPTKPETLLCSGPWGEYYFHNGHQFSVSKRKNVGGTDKPNWRFESSSFIETKPLHYYLQYGPSWSKTAETVDPDANKSRSITNEFAQQLFEEAFWRGVAHDPKSARVP